jgi:hypothetical protein
MDNLRTRTIAIVVGVVLATLGGGFVLAGSAAAAENIHDGSLTDPDTGENIYAANSSEETFGHVLRYSS